MPPSQRSPVGGECEDYGWRRRRRGKGGGTSHPATKGRELGNEQPAAQLRLTFKQKHLKRHPEQGTRFAPTLVKTTPARSQPRRIQLCPRGGAVAPRQGAFRAAVRQRGGAASVKGGVVATAGRCRVAALRRQAARQCN